MDSLNFELLFRQTAKGYRAQVINSPFGELLDEQSPDFTGVFQVPDQLEVKAYEQFGAALFNAIFQGEVLAKLRESMSRAIEQGNSLRLVLRLSNTPDLAGLPWEYLYDPTEERFFGLQDESPILRYLEVPQPKRPLAAARPLNLLAVIAAPIDQLPLDSDSEWEAIQAALHELETGGLVHLERLETCTLLELQRKLRQKEFHILHFIGHGVFDPDTGDGALLFEDDNGNGHAVTSKHLKVWLGDERRSLGLVVLNACDTSSATAGLPFAGVAQGLVQLGIPAVVANQTKIPDKAAVAFCREFYQVLAEGKNIEVALSQGRKAMLSLGYGVEWGIPTLFLRAAFDGPLFATQTLNIPKVAEALQQALPADDPTPRQLVETLKGFEYYHSRLFEWKELHNYLNNILISLGQFAREVERLDVHKKPVDPWDLYKLWRPVALEVDKLLDWAKSVRAIAEQPFTETESHELKGPDWAVKLQTARLTLDSLLKQEKVSVRELYDGYGEFNDVAETSMSQADKNLRDTAGELFNLSRVALGDLGHE